MVQLDRFEILFNNPEQAYFAGQEISGKVIIENKEPKKVNEILLELKGRARTYWTKHSGKSRKHCSHSEPYFLEQFNPGYTHKFTVVKDGKEKERILPAGIHQVPFSYTLPKSLPSSFEGEFGHIRYTCKAICERPWDFDIVSRKAFTVVGIEDINSDPKLNEPATCVESNHAVTFCCRSAGSVTGEIRISKCGYTPGEKIDVSFKVINLSSKTRTTALRFVQQTTYKAKTFAGHEHIKNVVRVISKIDKGEVPGGSTTEWQEESITIPSLPPKLGKCKILSVTYSVELEVEQTLTVPCPIVIGSIPQLSQLLIHSKQSVQSAGNGSLPKSSIKDSPPKWDSESCVQVTITDESGQLVEELGNEMEALLSARKRVRMPSSILSELYPTMPSPYYKMKFLLAVFLLAVCSLGESKKPKAQKVIYVQKVVPPQKQLSEYDLCKEQCRIESETQSNKERVELLKQEIDRAEQLLAEHNKHVDAPEIAPETYMEAGQVPPMRKASRYDHLKMAANKIVESTSELKNAVTGGGDN